MVDFGFSQFTTWPWPFERDVERYPAHGAQFIEICEFKLNRADYAPQLNSLGPLTVSSVQATVHSIFPDSLAPQPGDPARRVEHIQRAIERMAPHIPVGTPFVVITGAAPGGNLAQSTMTCESALLDLADCARSHKMRVAFEPLNPLMMNTDTFIWRLRDAVDLVERLDHPALGLCCDTWNIFPSVEALGRAAAKTLIVHLSDWRTPRCPADRRSLGDGCLDTAGMLRSLRQGGYRGPCVVEIFSSEDLPDSLWRSDLDAVLERNAAAFRRSAALGVRLEEPRPEPRHTRRTA